MSAAKTKPKEFGLSSEVPEAVLETELERARDAWKARSDAAAARVIVPAAPYRIRGDGEAGVWFVEAAEVVRSPQPTGPLHSHLLMLHLYSYGLGSVERRMPAEYYTGQMAALAENRPTAKLEWNKVGKRNRGFFTYARAAKWLREYLEPVREESTYFSPDGREAMA